MFKAMYTGTLHSTLCIIVYHLSSIIFVHVLHTLTVTLYSGVSFVLLIIRVRDLRLFCELIVIGYIPVSLVLVTIVYSTFC